MRAATLRVFLAIVARAWLSRILKPMEVHFSPETEKKLKELAALSGRGTADELVQDVVAGYFDELAHTREMLTDRIAMTT